MGTMADALKKAGLLSMQQETELKDTQAAYAERERQNLQKLLQSKSPRERNEAKES